MMAFRRNFSACSRWKCMPVVLGDSRVGSLPWRMGRMAYGVWRIRTADRLLRNSETGKRFWLYRSLWTVTRCCSFFDCCMPIDHEEMAVTGRRK